LSPTVVQVPTTFFQKWQTQRNMKTCWALVLGDCSEDISREHLVSESIFLDDTVLVQGFKWCKDIPKQVGLASLTSKILCRHHNSMLSILDSSAKASYEAIRSAQVLYETRLRLRKNKFWNTVNFKVSGILFERWVLKTLINLSFNQNFPIGNDGSQNGMPSDSLVKLVFGLQNFEGKSGLYSVVKTGEHTNFLETLRFAPLIYQGRYIAGAMFVIKGLRFVLFFGKEGPPNPLSNLGIQGDWGDSQLNFHNKEIIFNINNLPSHKVVFEW
jgi:hypothetical protein